MPCAAATSQTRLTLRNRRWPVCRAARRLRLGAIRGCGEPFGPGSEGHERPTCNELADGSLGAQVTPAQNSAAKLHTVRMPAPEVQGYGQALVGGEEAVLRSKRLPTDLNSQSRTSLDVPDPIRRPSPVRTNHDLTGHRVE